MNFSLFILHNTVKPHFDITTAVIDRVKSRFAANRGPVNRVLTVLYVLQLYNKFPSLFILVQFTVQYQILALIII